MRERTPSADDTPKRAPPAPPREAASADVIGGKTSDGLTELFRTTSLSSLGSGVVCNKMVASAHNLEELSVNLPVSSQQQQPHHQHQQDKHSSICKTTPTAQDKRSRLSNVINNLRKKVPDTVTSDSSVEANEERNSVETNLESLEKYVMTVLNGVMKEEANAEAEASMESIEKPNEKLETEIQDDDSKGPGSELEPSKPNESRTETAVPAEVTVEDRISSTNDSVQLEEVNKTENLVDNTQSSSSATETESTSTVDNESSKESSSNMENVIREVTQDAQKETKSVGDILENQSMLDNDDKKSEEATKESSENNFVSQEMLNDILSDIHELMDKNNPVIEDKETSESPENTQELLNSSDSTTSLHCSLPLDKVAPALQNCQTSEATASTSSQTVVKSTKPPGPPVRHMCLYCDRKFLSISLRQRHTERVHQMGGGRRSERNSRKPSQNCQYCTDKCSESLDSLFQHMVSNHSDKYHACVQCSTRYLTREALNGHTSDVHGSVPERPVVQVQEKIKEASPCPEFIKETEPGDRNDESTKKEKKPRAVVITLLKHEKKIVKDAFSNPGSPEFDSSFYSSVTTNIRENLLHHIDGKLQTPSCSTPSCSTPTPPSCPSISSSTPSSSPSSEPKSQSLYDHSNSIDISLTAATPVYSKDYSNEECTKTSECAQKPGKSSAHPRRVSFEKFNFPRKYDGREQSNNSIRDLSRFDISTQLTLKKKQLLIRGTNLIRFNQWPLNDFIKKTETVRQTSTDEGVSTCDEGKREEPCISSSSNDSGFHISSSGSTSKITSPENELEDNAEQSKQQDDSVLSKSTEFSVEFNRFMSLKKLDVNSVKKNLKTSDNEITIELSGECSRPRIYICGACGMKYTALKEMEEHKSTSHPNVWCSHFEFAGDQREHYPHVFVPGRTIPMFKLKNPELSEKVCTKCAKFCNTSAELHRHMLECAGDQTWLLGLFGHGKKKCKWRPFGSRSKRRRQRGPKRNIQNSQTPRNNQTREKQSSGPRIRPSDRKNRETIEKMLANLPAKRSTRKILQGGVQHPKDKLHKVQTRSRHGDTSSISRISRNKAVLRNKLLKNAKSIQRNKCRSNNINAVIESVINAESSSRRSSTISDIDKETKEKTEVGERTVKTKAGKETRLGCKRKQARTESKERTKNSKSKTSRENSSSRSTPKNSRVSSKENESDSENGKGKTGAPSSPKRKRTLDPVASLNASIKAKSQLRTQDGKFAKNPNKETVGHKSEEKSNEAEPFSVKPRLKPGPKPKNNSVNQRRITRLSSDSDKMPTLEPVLQVASPNDDTTEKNHSDLPILSPIQGAGNVDGRVQHITRTSAAVKSLNFDKATSETIVVKPKSNRGRKPKGYVKISNDEETALNANVTKDKDVKTRGRKSAPGKIPNSDEKETDKRATTLRSTRSNDNISENSVSDGKRGAKKKEKNLSKPVEGKGKKAESASIDKMLQNVPPEVKKLLDSGNKDEVLKQLGLQSQDLTSKKSFKQAAVKPKGIQTRRSLPTNLGVEKNDLLQDSSDSDIVSKKEALPLRKSLRSAENKILDSEKVITEEKISNAVIEKVFIEENCNTVNSEVTSSSCSEVAKQEKDNDTNVTNDSVEKENNDKSSSKNEDNPNESAVEGEDNDDCSLNILPTNKRKGRRKSDSEKCDTEENNKTDDSQISDKLESVTVTEETNVEENSDDKNNCPKISDASLSNLQIEMNIDSGKENTLDSNVIVPKLKVGRPKKSWGRREKASRRSLSNVIGILTEGVNIPAESVQNVVLTVQTSMDNVNSEGVSQISTQETIDNLSTSNEPSERQSGCEIISKNDLPVSDISNEPIATNTDPELQNENKTESNLPMTENVILQSESDVTPSENSVSILQDENVNISPELATNDIILDLARRKQNGKGSFLEKIVSKIAKQKDALLEGEVGSLLDNAADELTSILNEVGPVMCDLENPIATIESKSNENKDEAMTINENNDNLEPTKLVDAPINDKPENQNEVENLIGKSDTEKEKLDIPQENKSIANENESTVSESRKNVILPSSNKNGKSKRKAKTKSNSGQTQSNKRKTDNEKQDNTSALEEQSLAESSTIKNSEIESIEKEIDTMREESIKDEQISLHANRTKLNIESKINENEEKPSRRRTSKRKSALTNSYAEPTKDDESIVDDLLVTDLLNNSVASSRRQSLRNKSLDTSFSEEENVTSETRKSLPESTVESSTNIELEGELKELNTENKKTEAESVVPKVTKKRGRKKKTATDANPANFSDESKNISKSIDNVENVVEQQLPIDEPFKIPETRDAKKRKTKNKPSVDETKTNQQSTDFSENNKLENDDSLDKMNDVDKKNLNNSEKCNDVDTPSIDSQVLEEKQLVVEYPCVSEEVTENADTSFDSSINSTNPIEEEFSKKQEALEECIDDIQTNTSVDAQLSEEKETNRRQSLKRRAKQSTPLENLNKMANESLNEQESISEELNTDDNEKLNIETEITTKTSDSVPSDELKNIPSPLDNCEKGNDDDSEKSETVQSLQGSEAEEHQLADEVQTPKKRAAGNFAVVHTKSGEILIVEKRKKLTKEAAKFFCDVCTTSFTRKSSLKKHNLSQSHLIQLAKSDKEKGNVESADDASKDIFTELEDNPQKIAETNQSETLETDTDKSEKIEVADNFIEVCKTKSNENTHSSFVVSIPENNHLFENDVASREALEDELLDEEICKITENMSHDEYVLTDHISPVLPETSSTPVEQIVKKPQGKKEKKKRDKKKKNLADEHLDLDTPEPEQTFDSSFESNRRISIDSNSSKANSINIVEKITTVAEIHTSHLNESNLTNSDPSEMGSHNRFSLRPKRNYKITIDDSDDLYEDVNEDAIIDISKDDSRANFNRSKKSRTKGKSKKNTNNQNLFEVDTEQIETNTSCNIEQDVVGENQKQTLICSIQTKNLDIDTNKLEKCESEKPVISEKSSNIENQHPFQQVPSGKDEIKTTEFDSDDENSLNTDMSADIQKILNDSELTESALNELQTVSDDEPENPNSIKETPLDSTENKPSRLSPKFTDHEVSKLNSPSNERTTKKHKKIDEKDKEASKDSTSSKKTAKKGKSPSHKKSKTTKSRSKKGSIAKIRDISSGSENSDAEDKNESQNKSKIVKSVFGRVFAGEKTDKVKEVLNDWVSKSENESDEETEKLQKSRDDLDQKHSEVKSRKHRSRRSSVSSSVRSKKSWSSDRGRDQSSTSESQDDKQTKTKSNRRGDTFEYEQLVIPDSRCRQSKKRAEERISRAFDESPLPMKLISSNEAFFNLDVEDSREKKKRKSKKTDEVNDFEDKKHARNSSIKESEGIRVSYDAGSVSSPGCSSLAPSSVRNRSPSPDRNSQVTRDSDDDGVDISTRRISPQFAHGTPESSIDSSTSNEDAEDVQKTNPGVFSGEKVVIRSPTSSHREVITIAPTDAIEDNALDVPQEIETKPRQGKVLNFDQELFVECCSRLKATTENELRGAKKIKLDHSEAYHRKDDQPQSFRPTKDRWRDVESRNTLGSLLESVNQLLGEEISNTREKEYGKRSRNIRSGNSSRSASPDESRADNLGYEDSLDVAFEDNNKLRDKIQQRMRESENLIASTFGRKSDNDVTHYEHQTNHKSHHRNDTKHNYYSHENQSNLELSNANNENNELHSKKVHDHSNKVQLDSTGYKSKVNSSLGGLLDLLHSNGKHDHNGSTPMKLLAELACARAPTSTTLNNFQNKSTLPKNSLLKDSALETNVSSSTKDTQVKKSRNSIKELFEKKKEINDRKHQEKSNTEAALRELNIQRQRKTKKTKKKQDFPLIRKDDYGGIPEKKKRRDGLDRKNDLELDRIKDVYDFEDDESQIDSSMGNQLSYRTKTDKGFEVTCLNTKEIDVAGLKSKAIDDSLNNGKANDELGHALETMIDRKFKEIEKFAPKTKGALKSFQGEDQQQQITGPMDEFIERKRSKRPSEQGMKHQKLKRRSKNAKKRPRNAWYENDSSDEFRTAAKAADIGVGITKTQRTCSKGKQNLFAELSTSSESDFEDDDIANDDQKSQHFSKSPTQILMSESNDQISQSGKKYTINIENHDDLWAEVKFNGKRRNSEAKKSESESSDQPLVIDERKDLDDQRNSDDDGDQYNRDFELDDLYREDSSVVDSDPEEVAAARKEKNSSTKSTTEKVEPINIINYDKNELIPLEEALNLLDQVDDFCDNTNDYDTRIIEKTPVTKASSFICDEKDEIVDECENSSEIQNDDIGDDVTIELPEKLSTNDKPAKESDNVPLHVFISRKVQESKKRKQEQSKILEEQKKIMLDLQPTRRQRKCAIGKQGLLAEISSSDEETFVKDANRKSTDKSDNERPRKQKRESKEKKKERYMEKKHEQMIAKEQKAIEEEILREVGKKKDVSPMDEQIIEYKKEKTNLSENKSPSQKKKQQQKQRKENEEHEVINKDPEECENEINVEVDDNLKKKNLTKSPVKSKKSVKLDEKIVASTPKKSKTLNSDKQKNKQPSVNCKDQKERRSSSAKRDSDDEELKTTKSWNKVEEGVGVAIGRRKRAAANQLYYWSSSSDEEEIIESVPVAEEEEDERQEQHGWIVGDSHKKMITMLAMEKQLKEKRRRSEDEFELNKSKSKKHRNSTS